tara:strand:- start:888 stop:1187 length:300 start_codon:yes stop_codon:yes gene_type:complete
MKMELIKTYQPTQDIKREYYNLGDNGKAKGFYSYDLMKECNTRILVIEESFLDVFGKGDEIVKKKTVVKTWYYGRLSGEFDTDLLANKYRSTRKETILK